MARCQEARTEQIIDLYEGGNSIAEIAQQLEIYAETVKRAVIRAGAIPPIYYPFKSRTFSRAQDHRMTTMRVAGATVATIAARLKSTVARVQARLDELAHHELVKEHRATETPKERAARHKLVAAIQRRRYHAIPEGRAKKREAQARYRQSPAYKRKALEWKKRRRRDHPEIHRAAGARYRSSERARMVRIEKERRSAAVYAKKRQLWALRHAELDADGFAALVADLKAGRRHVDIARDWLIAQSNVSAIAIAVGIRKFKAKSRFGFVAQTLTPAEIASCLVQKREAA
jgi:hypothetical protein